jgi:predicted RNase H-like HicB family nuclease
MEKGYLDIVLNKEKLSSGKDVFVAHCVLLGITSQGETIDKAIRNIREAITLYLEEQPKNMIKS